MTSIYFDIEIRLDLLERNIVNPQVQHLSGARSTLRVPKVMTIRVPWHRDSLGFKCFKCINLSKDKNLVNTSCTVFFKILEFPVVLCNHPTRLLNALKLCSIM